ncbi:MAG: polysaccharide lyase family protein [Acidobacteriaceae bacterium]
MKDNDGVAGSGGETEVNVPNLLRCLLCMACLLCAASRLAAAGPRGPIATNTAVSTLWQIGTFDHSSGEFHSSFGVDYAKPSSDVDFIVGTSTDSDWLRFQPGPANGLAGGRLHPFRIHFSLSKPVTGEYALRVAVLFETPRLSSLRVDINGHSGNFYFYPRLDYSAGDWEGTFVPQTSYAERMVPIPSRWLQAGENVLTLTAIDIPATPENALGDIAPGISGIVYDALALEHSPAKKPIKGFELTARPTIFYRNSSTGLRELVNVCVESNGRAAFPRQVNLRVGGATISGAIRDAGEFGDACAPLAVPEWTGTVAAELRAEKMRRSVALKAQKKWTIDIVASEHLDIGFTDYRAKVAELQSQSIDSVLDVLPRHPEFRWTMDGSWIAQQYLAGRSTAKGKQLLNAIRSGGIVLPPQYANQHTGTDTLEGLARSLYYSHQLARRFQLPVGAANITDVPSYSWSYASVLHDAGIEYFAAGSNSWRAPAVLQGRWNEKSPFFWEGPDGGRVLMWYSRAYLQLASMFGVPPRTEAVHDALPVFLQAYTRQNYRSDTAILFGSQLENTAFDAGQVTLPATWAESFAYPRFRFSTFRDAMTQIRRQIGDANIETYRGDFGPYWEDGFASAARATAVFRQDQQRILTAEKMATLPALLNPSLRPNAKTLQDAWHNLLMFDEHTWTSAGATTQPESDETTGQWRLKQAEVYDARNDIAQSVERSWAQLESMIPTRHDALIVLNALSWPRSGWLDTDLPAGDEIVDAGTGKTVPTEALRVEPGTMLPGFGGKTLRVRYRADDVPGLGYKVFSVVASPASSIVQQPQAVRAVMENRFYKITLDSESGSIRSIFDKALDRELVSTDSPYRFGEYVYVTGADDMPDNSLYRYGAALPPPVLTVHPAAHGRIVSFQSSENMERAVLESSAPNTPMVRTEISLPSDVKRIDLRITLQKVSTLHKEAAYIAFPFAVHHPDFAYDTQTGWVDPAHDELLGGSREWYVAQHWAAVHNDKITDVVELIDAPLVAFGDIVRGAWPADFKPKSSTLFSWIMSNYWETNFMSSQGGRFNLRYAITSADTFQPPDLTRQGWDAMTPLEANFTAANPGGTRSLSADHDSFLIIDNPNAVMTTWKLAEDGDGSIVRLEEIAGRTEQVTVRPAHLQVVRARRCTLLEDCAEEIPATGNEIRLTMKPFEILTLRLNTTPEMQP